MSLDDTWAEALDDVTLTMLYRTFNGVIEADNYAVIPTKGEQDTAWAVKHEFERRWEAQGRNNDHGGVWKLPLDVHRTMRLSRSN